MNKVFAIHAVVVLTGIAAAQQEEFVIAAVAPATVEGGGFYEVQFWADFSNTGFVDGLSAISAFAVDAFGNANAAAVSDFLYADWVAVDPNNPEPTINGVNVEDIYGGQLANLFGILNPDIDLSNPILLFSFTVEATYNYGSVITYTAGNPHPNGGLSYYPDSEDAATIIAPNDANATLSFISANTTIIPAPPSIALLGLGALAARRRR